MSLFPIEIPAQVAAYQLDVAPVPRRRRRGARRWTAVGGDEFRREVKMTGSIWVTQRPTALDQI